MKKPIAPASPTCSTNSPCASKINSSCRKNSQRVNEEIVEFSGRRAMNPPARDLHPSNMAEQAQRRAPVAQAQEKPTDNNHAYEELRELIVKPEQEGIAAIQDRLENLEKRTQDVSSVVAEAIQMRREKGDDEALADALAPT